MGAGIFFSAGFAADLYPVSVLMLGALLPVTRTSSRPLPSSAIALPTHSVYNSAVPFVGIVCLEIQYLYLASRYHKEGKLIGSVER